MDVPEFPCAPGRTGGLRSPGRCLCETNLQSGLPDDGKPPGRRRPGAGDLPQGLPKAETVRPRKKFFTWLYTIALNIIRNHLKSSPERTARLAEMNHPPSDPVDPENPEGLFLDREKAKLMGVCLQKLPSELKETVVLRYYQDLSFDEIATITNASVSAVKMRVYRGLERLRALMSERVRPTSRRAPSGPG
jgi:RNA polymerase sigma factor (sigma-70 family)